LGKQNGWKDDLQGQDSIQCPKNGQYKEGQGRGSGDRAGLSGLVVSGEGGGIRSADFEPGGGIGIAGGFQPSSGVLRWRHEVIAFFQEDVKVGIWLDIAGHFPVVNCGK